MDGHVLEVARNVFLSPVFQSVLLAVGLWVFSFEIHLPGTGAPAALGTFLLIVFLFAGLAQGRVSGLELLCVGVGSLLLGFELFVTPGFGAAGVLGLGMLLLATLFGMVGPNPTADELQRAVLTLLVSLGLAAGTGVAGVRKVGRLRGPLVSSGRLSGRANGPSPSHMVGRIGITVSDCRPAGRVAVDGEIVAALARDGYLTRGIAVAVRGVRAGELVVTAHDARPESDRHGPDGA